VRNIVKELNNEKIDIIRWQADPLRLLEEADTRELSPGDLGQADGGAGLGIWQAQGRSGVGVVRLK
jgi:hypothetical protein